MKTHSELLEKVESFQNMLISYATGGAVDEDEFKRLRDELLNEPLVKERLPQLVRTHKDFKQFWGFIKQRSCTHQFGNASQPRGHAVPSIWRTHRFGEETDYLRGIGLR